MKPRIGITCSVDTDINRFFLNQFYVESIRTAGGIPIPLFPSDDKIEIKQMIGLVQGIVLSGGVDVDPIFFGEEPQQYSGRVCPLRDSFEIKLTSYALAEDIPLLGICRGMQVLNIAAGGDIFQDIYAQNMGVQLLKHRQEAPQWYPTHGINIKAGTMLESIMGVQSVRVNSYHHQAVRNAAPGFVVSAKSADGVIEAIESLEHGFALGLQCHPESLWQKQPVFIKPFKQLIKTAER